MSARIPKTTVSVTKADVGSISGHATVHPEMIELARRLLDDARAKKSISDYHVTHVGDDLDLILTHTMGKNNPSIHELAWRCFKEIAEKILKPLKPYSACQDLLSDAFSGNAKGMGPGVAELEFTERESDPVLIFMADKTEPRAWNLPLFKILQSSRPNRLSLCGRP